MLTSDTLEQLNGRALHDAIFRAYSSFMTPGLAHALETLKITTLMFELYGNENVEAAYDLEIAERMVRRIALRIEI